MITDDKSLLQKMKDFLFKSENVPEIEDIPILKAMDVEQRKCIEIVYKPLVKDVHGEWMSEDTIRVAEDSFRRNMETGVVTPNLYHVTPTTKFSVTKSWVLEQDTKFEGRDEIVTKGTWLAETHYQDDHLWEMKKSKQLGGLSLGGYGKRNNVTGEITNLFFNKEEFKNALSKLEEDK